MSIKSVTNPSCPKPTTGFPKLMQTKIGTVALVGPDGRGVVLKSNCWVWEVGQLYEAFAFAMDHWSDFEGTLVLSNEP